MMALDEELTLKSVETAAKLPTPDVLFSRPPYTLMLSFSQTRITIQASHSGSLQLIKSYFELHASTNPNDVRNVSDACLEYAESVSVHMLFNLLVPYFYLPTISPLSSLWARFYKLQIHPSHIT